LAYYLTAPEFDLSKQPEPCRLKACPFILNWMVYPYEAQDDDPEFIPLSTAPTYATHEDFTDEHLPTYNEVLAEQARLRRPSNPVSSKAWNDCSPWLAFSTLSGAALLIAGIVM
jgi:hypothetical protein